MAVTTAWGNLSDEISNSNAIGFKEKAISLLRILNPSFQECIDIPGIDFVVWTDDGKLDWVVQCQVFDVSLGLDRDHSCSIVNTTQKFIDEGLECNRYWVLHNHQHGKKGYGKFLEFLNELDTFRAQLEYEGKIKEFWVGQRQEFLQRAEQEFRNVLRNLLEAYSGQYRINVEEKLQFGKYYISNVPAEEFEIIFKEYEPVPDIKLLTSSLNENIAELVVSERKDIRWTLVHGEAGAGKTTTSLHAALAKSKVVFFVNCDILNFYSLRRKGTNLFLEHILRTLNILEVFECEQDRELLYSLSGATLAKTVEHSKEHVLIFDGLDENRFYSDPSCEGLKRLSETLVDIHCPIILVTRTSHFEESLFSNLGALVEINNTRGGSKARRKARAIKLPVWSEKHVLQLLDKILNNSANEFSLDDESFQRIRKFRNLFLGQQYQEFYGELPLNPLFLQFILSDIVERDIHKVSRVTLIYQWVRQKIFRDLEKENRSFPVDKKVPNETLFLLVDKILYIMELVSKSMTIACDDGTFKLNDFTDYQEIEGVAAKVFQIDDVKIIDLLLNSLLTSHITLTRGRYRSTKQRITFIFKILQEYFLACYLARNQEDVSLYPRNICQLCKEIIQTEYEEDLSFYLRRNFNILAQTPFFLKTENLQIPMSSSNTSPDTYPAIKDQSDADKVMARLSESEVKKIVNRYIGVSEGYLGDFNHGTHARFYPEYCGLEIDPDDYQRPEDKNRTTVRKRFISILESSSREMQAKIIRGVLQRFPLSATDKKPSTRTKELYRELLELAQSLEETSNSECQSIVEVKEIFISYTWGGQAEELVNLLEENFQSRGVTIVRDKNSLEYRGNIKEFMERLGRGKCIIAVICDKYLKSRSCMFELVQVFTGGSFHDRIFPIIMDDAQIYDPVKRIQYVEYWEKEIQELNQAFKRVDPANLQGFREDIDLYTKIRATISDLTSILRNTNALTSEMHGKSNFSILFNSIESKLLE
jgi:TIR domain